MTNLGTGTQSPSTGATNNPISVGNLYPRAPVNSTAQESTPAAANTGNAGATPIEQNYAGMIHDNPVYALIGLLILTVGLMVLATRFGGGKPAANVKFSLYNIFTVLAIGILGGSLAKVVASRYNLPFGISKIILAS